MNNNLYNIIIDNNFDIEELNDFKYMHDLFKEEYTKNEIELTLKFIVLK